MARQANARGAGSRLGRTETVSIRLDPRLNYLCELAARSQRRTKSSFIEATIDQRIHSIPIDNWRDETQPETIGDRASYLWHVRESQRLVSLGLIAPHLMTFEEQQIWAYIRECGFFWRGRWKGETWVWNCEETDMLRERVDEYWETIVAVAEGEKDRDALPATNRKAVVEVAVPPGLDDEIPF